MRVFISHAFHEPRDRGIAERLTILLSTKGVQIESQNLKIFFPEHDDLFKGLQTALKHPNHILLLLSKAYFDDDWLAFELSALISEELKSGPRGLLVPVSIDGSPIPAATHLRKLYNWPERFISLAEDEIISENSNAVKRIHAQLSTPRKVFVIMAFTKPELNSAYENVIKTVIREFGYEPIRMDQIYVPGGITDQILAEIQQSEIIVAEMSGERPSCYYEAGYAHALNKQMILTNFKGSPIGFSLHDHQFVEWQSEPELDRKLRAQFRAIVGSTKTNRASGN